MWTKNDTVYLALFFAAFFILGIAAANDIIDRSVTFLAVLSLMFLCIANPWYSTKVNQALNKQFNKGMTAYWAEIRDILIETSNKYPFLHNLNLPEQYIPAAKTELPEIKFALFDIDSTELELGYGEEYAIANGKMRPEHMTIIYHAERGVIIGSPLKDLDQTIQMIKDNKEYFTKQTLYPTVPVETTKTTYGQMKTG